ncbi:MAG: hypothetical protein HY040_08130 [Planctomycetes bacterium]|nr:hypothetical protein [Planctomycetota bacterium]
MSFHEHVHEHVHDHHSGGDDSYYIDQLCMVAISGAFGTVCLALYFWQTKMLELLLGPQFHIYVLISGIILVALAVLRAGALWAQVGKAPHAHQHSHDHEPDHEHAPGEACNHEHGHHEHEHQIQTHAHSHGHAHGHSHDQSHADHDHGWAPWRYVVLLLPIVLFLLGIPNKPPALAESRREDYTASAEIAGLAAAGSDRWAQFCLVLAYFADSSKEESRPIDFMTLKNAADTKSMREYWDKEMITVRGQYQPSATNDRIFNLVRFKINCCFNDAIPISIPMRCRESLPNIKSGEWVQVRGRVQFQRTGNSFVTIVSAPTSKDVQLDAPDPQPWVQ